MVPAEVVTCLNLSASDPLSDLQTPHDIDGFSQKFYSGHFGNVRPPDIYINREGAAALGAGKHYFNTPNVSCFRGLVSFFLYDLIGHDFFQKQESSAPSEKHPLAIWKSHIDELYEAHRSTASATAPESGDTVCWTMLAYQLYLAYEYSTLPSDLLSRLRNPAGFQGARFEILAAAVMITAGYDIKWIEGGKDKIAEFIATHRATGLEFAVEAKSRHRPEVLAKGAKKPPAAPPSAGLQKLISKALAKNPALPLIIFLEANVPFAFEEMSKAMEHEIDANWKRTLRRKDWEQLGGFPCVGMVVSNDRTWWDLGAPHRTGKNSNWLRWYDGPNRHGLDGKALCDDIFTGFKQAGRVPDFHWTNTTLPRPKNY